VRDCRNLPTPEFAARNAPEGAMSDCLFCKIVNKQIPASIVYEDDQLLAFNDIDPRAPTHVLIIPRRHISSLSALTEDDDALVGRMARVAATIAADRSLAGSGFRTVFNTGRDAGQSVSHIHLHLLGGRSLAWPPG
jgi:histidine triad (HIT) family protein